MPMKLVKYKEITEDGVEYIVKIYSNGESESIVKTPKSVALSNRAKPTQLDRIEAATEYLMAMQE